MFKQICLGTKEIHSKGYVHRDIKPENILITNSNQPKICDFGWSSEIGPVDRSTFCGTYEYMAPEIYEKEVYDVSVDIWSLGILLYEFIHAKSPFSSESVFKIYRNILEEEITFQDNIDKDAKDLIVQILKKKPDERPSLDQIITHKFINKFDFVLDNYLDSENKKLKRNEKHLSIEIFDKYSTNNTKIKNKIISSMDDPKYFSKTNLSISSITNLKKNKKGKKSSNKKRNIKKDLLTERPNDNHMKNTNKNNYNLYSIFKIKNMDPPPRIKHNPKNHKNNKVLKKNQKDKKGLISSKGFGSLPEKDFYKNIYNKIHFSIINKKNQKDLNKIQFSGNSTKDKQITNSHSNSRSKKNSLKTLKVEDILKKKILKSIILKEIDKDKDKEDLPQKKIKDIMSPVSVIKKKNLSSNTKNILQTHKKNLSQLSHKKNFYFFNDSYIKNGKSFIK